MSAAAVASNSPPTSLMSSMADQKEKRNVGDGDDTSEAEGGNATAMYHQKNEADGTSLHVRAHPPLHSGHAFPPLHSEGEPSSSASSQSTPQDLHRHHPLSQQHPQAHVHADQADATLPTPSSSSLSSPTVLLPSVPPSSHSLTRSTEEETKPTAATAIAAAARTGSSAMATQTSTSTSTLTSVEKSLCEDAMSSGEAAAANKLRTANTALVTNAIAKLNASSVAAAPVQPFTLLGDLRRILVEVARTGSCSWLPWDHPDAVVIGASRVAVVAASAAASEGVKEHRIQQSVGSTCTSGMATPTTSGTYSSTLPASGLNSLSTPASTAAIAKFSKAIAATSASSANAGMGGGPILTKPVPSSTASSQSLTPIHPNAANSMSTSPATAPVIANATASPASKTAGTATNMSLGGAQSSSQLATSQTAAALVQGSTPTTAPSTTSAQQATHTSPPTPNTATAASASAQPYQQSFSTHRRPVTALGAKPPSRKKHRKNGRHSGGAAYRQAGVAAGSRKRPLFLIRTPTNASPNAAVAMASGACGSVGSSGRASGSEMDDSTQYECDSEGTSATTNSEMSWDRSRSDLSVRGKQMRGGQNTAVLANLRTGYMMEDATLLEEESAPPIHYKTMQEAVRVAIGLVLDHFYRRRGGYKLSPAEEHRNAMLEASAGDSNSSSNAGSNVGTHGGPASSSTDRDSQDAASTTSAARSITGNAARQALSAEAIFQQRRERLLLMLISSEPDREGWMGKPRGDRMRAPPFTIQRIAEVLLNPEKYYTQTHKLCNCLEKLLLVTSSTRAFGGSTGGATSQSRTEERELAALADEQGRVQSELRQRRVKRRMSSPSDDTVVISNVHDAGGPRNLDYGHKEHSSDDVPSSIVSKKMKRSSSPDMQSRQTEGVEDTSTREVLVAAARASLRSKFEHVGIDTHSSSSNANRDARSMTENRTMTKSPPPPSLAMSASKNVGLSGHTAVTGFVRQHHPEQGNGHHGIGRLHTPILLTPTPAPAGASHNMQVLHLQHAPPGLQDSLSHSGGVRSNAMELLSYNHSAGAAAAAAAKYGAGNATESQSQDAENEPGRSSASNSDVDSESDDVSFDDSASDRSDGSDSGSLTHYEPFSPARAMALNRMQQQQRLQNRAYTSFSSLHPNDPSYRPPADSEYQSGDSIDSTRAEDSCGSDSSSSDIAD